VVRFGSTTAPIALVGDVLDINGTANHDVISIDAGQSHEKTSWRAAFSRLTPPYPSPRNGKTCRSQLGKVTRLP
jgi:hypothetical protein